MKQPSLAPVLSLLALFSILLISCNSEPKKQNPHKALVSSSSSSQTKASLAKPQKSPSIDTVQIPDERTAIGKVHLTGGVFHDGEVLGNIEQLSWLGLFKNNDGYYIRKTILRTSRQKDEIMDDDNEISGWMVDADNKDFCQLLIKSMPELKEAAVDTFVLKKDIIYPGESLSIETRSGTYRLSATGRITAQTADWKEIENYKLYLESTVDGKSVKQLIAAIPRFNDTMLSILWCGDLDLDGKPDFIIDTSYHYNMVSHSLYLSGKALKGKLLRYIGTFSITGC